MQEVVPNYYEKFQCIADKCRHNCCIGWEIEIDEDALKGYQRINMPLGERIRKSIEGEPPHFILGDGGRCPFLNEEGLCEIILESGEKNLCEICTMHPRFRNFYENFYETGLGLCCEEAVRLILSETEPCSILLPTVEMTEEEEVFFGIRQRLFDILQERNCSMKERLSRLGETVGITFSFSLDKLREIYLSLERLEEEWTQVLENLKGFSFQEEIFQEEAFQIPMEQLAVYFLFRHLADALWDGEYEGRIHFVLMSCYLLGALWERDRSQKGQIDWASLTELVRKYSAETEYSEENMEKLIFSRINQ